MYPQPTPASIEPERSWMGKHPALIIGVAVIVVLAGLGAAIVYMAFSMMSNSGPAQLAFDTASRSPALAQRLGAPLKKGRMVSGNISVSGPSGQAELSMPISGPKGEGTLYLQAHKQADLWQLDMLQFGPKDTDERIDLLGKGVAPPQLMNQ
jgi:hypothetical protein